MCYFLEAKIMITWSEHLQGHSILMELCQISSSLLEEQNCGAKMVLNCKISIIP